jgi:hypothetical protein
MAYRRAMAPGWWKRLTQPAPVISPTGTYTDVAFPATNNGYDDFAWELTLRTDPSPDGYFWSHQFGFVGGDQGYCGLQTYNHDLGGKIAIFSIWSALGSDGPSWAGPFGGEGTGFTARIPYEWRTDTTYRLRVSRADRTEIATWWRAEVTDPFSGRTSEIGVVAVPPAWAGLAATSVMWTERYAGPMLRCSDLRHAVADFTHPTAADGQVAAVRMFSHLADPPTCPNSTFQAIAGGARHEMGVPEGATEPT